MAKISVILPVYNGERWIDGAVRSVLQQDYADLELIVLNDGSTDRTQKLLSFYSDRRLVNVYYSSNAGYSSRLNEGIAIASGEFIARMDADDIAHRSRLSTQLKAFQSDNQLMICGTWTYQIDHFGRVIGQHRCATLHPAIAVHLLANITLVHHPTVMMRRSAVEVLDAYDTKFEPAEDFEMWTRAVAAHLRMHVLPQHLLLYRRHPDQVSAIRKEQQWEAGRKAVSNMLMSLSKRRLEEQQRCLAFAFFTADTRLGERLDASLERLLTNTLLEIREDLAVHLDRSVLEPLHWSIRKISMEFLRRTGSLMWEELCWSVTTERPA